MDAKDMVEILEEMNPSDTIQFNTKSGFEFNIYRKENKTYDIEIKDYSGDGIIAMHFDRALIYGGNVNFYSNETRVFVLNPYHIFYIYKVNVFGCMKINA